MGARERWVVSGKAALDAQVALTMLAACEARVPFQAAKHELGREQ